MSLYELDGTPLHCRCMWWSVDACYNNFIEAQSLNDYRHFLCLQLITIELLKNFNFVQLYIGGNSDGQQLSQYKINCQNLMYSGLSPRSVAASAVEDNILVIVLVIVVNLVNQIEVEDRWEQSSSDGICLSRWEVLDPYILNGLQVQSKSVSNRRMQLQLGYGPLLRILLSTVQSWPQIALDEQILVE
jgi:hypothetical protein